MTRISVALAAWQGERYLAAQVESILCQLGAQDELILSVNPSTDRTEMIARDLAARDRRVRVCLCPQRGVIANFDHALRHATGDIVFLSDQDDLWLPGKVETVLAVLSDPAIAAVVHGRLEVDADGQPLPCQSAPRPAHDLTRLSILWRNEAQGCCMALRREALQAALPLPERLPMHDSYLALVACGLGRVRWIPDQLIAYRRHGGNASPAHHQKLSTMLRDRWQLISALRARRRKPAMEEKQHVHPD